MEDLPDLSRSALGAPASPLPPVVDEGQERGGETMPSEPSPFPRFRLFKKAKR